MHKSRGSTSGVVHKINILEENKKPQEIQNID